MRRTGTWLTVGFVALAGFAWSLVTAADVSDGLELYTQYCESCHGVDGQGIGGMGELVTRGQLLKPDESLFEVIADGQMSMPGFDGLLTSEEIRDVILYLRTVQ